MRNKNEQNMLKSPLTHKSDYLLSETEQFLREATESFNSEKGSLQESLHELTAENCKGTFYTEQEIQYYEKFEEELQKLQQKMKNSDVYEDMHKYFNELREKRDENLVYQVEEIVRLKRKLKKYYAQEVNMRQALEQQQNDLQNVNVEVSEIEKKKCEILQEKAKIEQLVQDVQDSNVFKHYTTINDEIAAQLQQEREIQQQKRELSEEIKNLKYNNEELQEECKSKSVENFKLNRQVNDKQFEYNEKNIQNQEMYADFEVTEAELIKLGIYHSNKELDNRSDFSVEEMQEIMENNENISVQEFLENYL